MASSDPILLPTALLEVDADLPVVRLPHPRTRLPALFVIRDGQGIWEIQSVVPPATSARAWFFEPSPIDQPDQVLSLQAGRLLFVTAFDPFFLLLGLFFGHNTSEGIFNPFDASSKKSHKNENARFEEIDSILEKAQENWLFAGSEDRPTTGDVELFTCEAFRPQHLARIFSPLDQDSGTTLWRVEPERIMAELKRKIDHLTTAGLQAGREPSTIWARLATKEILALDITETRNATFLLNEIYKKISLNMIQAYLPSCVSEQLCSLNEYEFKELTEETKKKEALSTINPLEIGRKDNKNVGGTSSNNKTSKPPPAKKSKKNEPALSKNTRKIDSFFTKPQASSSTK